MEKNSKRRRNENSPKAAKEGTCIGILCINPFPDGFLQAEPGANSWGCCKRRLGLLYLLIRQVNISDLQKQFTWGSQVLEKPQVIGKCWCYRHKGKQAAHHSSLPPRAACSSSYNNSSRDCKLDLYQPRERPPPAAPRPASSPFR